VLPLPSDAPGTEPKCVLTWYAAPAHARQSGSRPLADPMPGRQYDLCGVETISTGVLVLSYTEFVRQPVRGHDSCVKNGCTREDD
jgi:hypothetical protein